MYGYNTRSQFEEVIGVLDRRQVKYVLWDTVQEKKDIELFFPGVKQVRSGERIIEPYLESHYKVVQVVDGVRIMERKSEGDAN